MGEEVVSVRHQVLVISTIIITFELLSWWLKRLKEKRGPTDPTVIRMRTEISQLLAQGKYSYLPEQIKEHQRLFDERDEELRNYQALYSEEREMLYDICLKVLFSFKVLTGFVLICWFLGVPVATISQRLVQPFALLLAIFNTGHLLLSLCLGRLKKKKEESFFATRMQMMEETKEIEQLIKEGLFLQQHEQVREHWRLLCERGGELRNYEALYSEEWEMLNDICLKVLFSFKVLTGFVLICWFLGVPVATISQRLVQPFGKLLWRTGGTLNNRVRVKSLLTYFLFLLFSCILYVRNPL